MKVDAPIGELLGRGRPVLSVEFFPPKDEEGGRAILDTALAIQRRVAPDFVSITYGAGGTTRERTYRYARILREEYGFTVMPHLTCVGSSRQEIAEIIDGYHREGFRNLMALRGDPPKGDATFRPHPEGFGFASELVGFVRKRFPDLCLGVAGYPEVHPEATDAVADLRHLLFKVGQGASFVTTQLFYDNASYFAFVDRARRAGLTVPILPGLMPIRSATQARKFCQNIPAELDALLTAAGDDEAAVQEVGIAWCRRQIEGLLAGGAPGVHLYIMNRSGAAIRVVEGLEAAAVLGPRGRVA